jgi:PII-like signaling protein
VYFRSVALRLGCLTGLYRDKKVVGVFILRFRAPLPVTIEKVVLGSGLTDWSRN